MSVDRREGILSELFVILGGYTGFTVVRNRAELPATLRPALILLDGHETASETAYNKGKVVSANKVVMRPEVIILLDNRKPINESIGQDLNIIRLRIINDLYSSAILRAIVGTNGEIRYEGMETDLSRGRDMMGEIALQLAFVYPLLPVEL